MSVKRNPQARTSGGQLKVTITIDPDQMSLVDSIADHRRTSRSSIVRTAIDFYLAEMMGSSHITLSSSQVTPPPIPAPSEVLS